MADIEKIKIVSIVGNNICVAAEDGEKIFWAIVKAFEQGKNVELSFKDIGDLTSLFLNAAVGQLYSPKAIPGIDLKSRLFIVDITEQDKETLARTIQRAKEYFQYPDRFHSATEDVLGDDSEPSK